jgi:cytidylate kinase
MSRSIAIDGPAGAGKSTIAKKVAKELGFIYVDTGAMYRAMALYMINNGIDASETEKISATCQSADITIKYENGIQVVYLNGENVNSLIRTEAVGNMASASSVNGDVRKKLVELQQKLAQTTDVVMDGRDIGTVVLPNADLKVYLTADEDERARRRKLDYELKGESLNLEEVKKELLERDYRDTHREVSPLKKANDAVVVDTTNYKVEEVRDIIIDLFNEKRK